jgi:hypothetical protein
VIVQGKRKWLLAVLTLVLGAALAFTGGLSTEFVQLALVLNAAFAAGNGVEHFAQRKAGAE